MTSSVIYYSTHARQNEIYLLNNDNIDTKFRALAVNGTNKHDFCK